AGRHCIGDLQTAIHHRTPTHKGGVLAVPEQLRFPKLLARCGEIDLLPVPVATQRLDENDRVRVIAGGEKRVKCALAGTRRHELESRRMPEYSFPAISVTLRRSRARERGDAECQLDIVDPSPTSSGACQI